MSLLKRAMLQHIEAAYGARKKQVILVLSDAGNIGKTKFASLILETLRQKTVVDAYVCDSNFQGLFDRYGQKDKKGFRIPLAQQDPSIGVGYLDISNPSESSKFSTYLGSPAEFMLFDLPANSTQALATCMGTPQDFIDFMEFADAEPIFVCPIKDAKSVLSYENLRATFPDQRFVVFINGGAIKASYGVNTKAAQEEIAAYKAKFSKENVDLICLEHILSERVFNLLENHTFREVFTPRTERRNADGTFSAGDDDFLAKDRGDQFILNKLIPEATDDIAKVFL